MLGYVSYPVRAFVLNPLQWDKGVCSFDTELLPDKVMLEYVSYPVRAFVLNPLQWDKGVCVNCWGAHVDGDQKCPVRVRQVEVARYEAVRKVEDGGLRVREPERIPVSSKPVQSDPNSLCFSKVGFLGFIAMVINCITQMEWKSQKIDLLIAAAEKFWDVTDFSAKELQGVLRVLIGPK